MVDVIIDGEVAYCLPDCTCCTACHKLIDEVEECPFPSPNGLLSDKVLPHLVKSPYKTWNHYRETMNNLIATQPKVMMTHYAPYEMGVAFEYRLDRNTPFFYFDGKEFLEQMPDDSYWICGHVHNVFSTDYTKENGGIVHMFYLIS